MSDGATLVVGLLGLIAAMIFVIVRQQRRKEARLAALAEIEIPILSTLRSALIIAPSMAVAPVLVAVVGAHWERWQVDLDQPCELAEASAFGPASIPVQVLAIKQGGGVLAFSYGLPMGRKPYGDHAVDRYIEPFVDAEARVIHDRLRRRASSSSG